MRHAPIVQVLQRAGQAGSDARGRRSRKRATWLLAQKLAQVDRGALGLRGAGTSGEHRLEEDIDVVRVLSHSEKADDMGMSGSCHTNNASEI